MTKPAAKRAGPSFSTSDGRTFKSTSRTTVEVKSVTGEVRTYEYAAHCWWPMVDGRRARYSVAISSTLHKLLTRATALRETT